MGYYALEPFGDQRADVRNALIAKLIHDSHCAKGGAKKMEDFMLFKAKPPTPKLELDILTAFQKIKAAQENK